MVVRRTRLLLVLVALAAAGAIAAPSTYRAWWRVRASNPVRHGIALAGELGCFHCHGELGRDGLHDPLAWRGEVPAWDGEAPRLSRDELRRVILDGDLDGPREPSGSPEHALAMPAYRSVLDDVELDALVSAVQVLSGDATPTDAAPRRGMALADTLGCVGCHGPAGSGGRSNPRSATGFIPGWYGRDFEHLVRDRAEFDVWIRTGRSPRLDSNPLAAWFSDRQLVAMPAYPDVTAAELDDLWAYVRWLAASRGGPGAVTPRRRPG